MVLPVPFGRGHQPVNHVIRLLLNESNDGPVGTLGRVKLLGYSERDEQHRSEGN